MEVTDVVPEEVQNDENHDFDGYLEPCQDFGGMSEEEEDYIDDMMDDPDYTQPDEDLVDGADSQASSFMGSQEPIGSVYWQDASVEDDQCPNPKSRPFKPHLPPGVNTGRLRKNSFKTPMEFMSLFLTSQLITSLCIATNHFAESLISKGMFSSYAQLDGSWCRVTEEEMYQFIGIIIYMSFTKMSTMDRYWSSNCLYSFNPVPRLLPKRRFQSILAFLQITPPVDIDKNDKLTRISPLLHNVNTVSQEWFQPSKEVAVDERMVASRHKYSGIRQFIKDKPVKFGIKLWILADTETGYTYNFFVYLGKKRSDIIDKGKGLAYNVVLKLISPLLYQGYDLFVDNFYTTLSLIKDLLNKSTYLIGAVRRNSSAMPLCFKTSIDQWEKVACRGDCRWHRQDGYVTVQWKDCRTVTIVSPIHKGSDTTSCLRTIKHRTGFKKTNVSQPLVVNSYNFGMLGEDKSNQYVTQYPSYLRTKFHWWKVLFFHSIDIMIVNAFVLYKQSNNDLLSHFGQLEFRECIFQYIFNTYGKKETVNTINECLPVVSEKRVDCVVCNAEAGMQGIPLPSRKTVVKCENCNVGLCLTRERNCFKIWHNGSESMNLQNWHKRRGNNRKRKCEAH